MRDPTLALDVAHRHDRLAALTSLAARQLHGMQLPEWRGPAAEAYREDLATAASALLHNAEAHDSAARIWRGYAGTLAAEAAAHSAFGIGGGG